MGSGAGGQSAYIRRPRSVVALHLHQRVASLDARERLAAFASTVVRSDTVVLLTCHRVEMYLSLSRDVDAEAEVARRLDAPADALRDARILAHEDAALHLFRVAAGLDSVLVGEPQIANQLRRTFDSARGGGLDPILCSLIQRALHLAREVRATTPLGEVRRSVGSLAVDEALSHLPDPPRSTALVIGAGEIGKLAARSLAHRVGHLVVANRDAARAMDVAVPVGAEPIGLDALSAALVRADVVISAADTRGTLLTRELLAERLRAGPLVLVDIAVPRSVAPEARSLSGLTYRDVDQLAARTRGPSEEAVASAERRCAEEARAFTAWLRERDSAPTIRAVRDRAEAIRERQLRRALRRLGHLNDRDRLVVRSLASSLTHALLHEPTVRMRSGPAAESAARSLFGIEP